MPHVMCTLHMCCTVPLCRSRAGTLSGLVGQAKLPCMLVPRHWLFRLWPATQPTPSKSWHVISPCEGTLACRVDPTLLCALTPILQCFELYG